MRQKTKEKYSSAEWRDRYEKIKNEIFLTAVLNSVYTEKISAETIHTKVTNQLNSINVGMDKINPKFNEKSKNYDKIKEQLVDTLGNYESNLKQFCNKCDAKINNIILKKVELESELLMEIVAKDYYWEKKDKNEWKEHQSRIKRLEKEIKIARKQINDWNEQKVKKIFEAMETEGKMLSTQIRKPHSFKKITKFFVNRFNTYQVILKTILIPIQQRIDEFKVNELKKVEMKYEEFNLQETEAKIKQKQNVILETIENQKICKQMGILG